MQLGLTHSLDIFLFSVWAPARPSANQLFEKELTNTVELYSTKHRSTRDALLQTETPYQASGHAVSEPPLTFCTASCHLGWTLPAAARVPVRPASAVHAFALDDEIGTKHHLRSRNQLES